MINTGMGQHNTDSEGGPMIKNQWYGILDAKELKGKRPVGVTRMGEKWVFWRASDGSIREFDTCIK